MRILALDIGEKRVGVAVSDPRGLIGTPLAVLDAARILRDRSELARVLADYDDIGRIVIGIPLSLDGTEGPQAARVRAAGDRIARFTGLPVVYVDERLSSVEAERRMAEAGTSSRGRRGSVDKVAAAILLQAYLDSGAGR